eukprot:PhF_6_TR30754/c0_g1_i1/m.45290
MTSPIDYEKIKCSIDFIADNTTQQGPLSQRCRTQISGLWEWGPKEKVLYIVKAEIVRRKLPGLTQAFSSFDVHVSKDEEKVFQNILAQAVTNAPRGGGRGRKTSSIQSAEIAEVVCKYLQATAPPILQSQQQSIPSLPQPSAFQSPQRVVVETSLPISVPSVTTTSHTFEGVLSRLMRNRLPHFTSDAVSVLSKHGANYATQILQESRRLALMRSDFVSHAISAHRKREATRSADESEERGLRSVRTKEVLKQLEARSQWNLRRKNQLAYVMSLYPPSSSRIQSVLSGELCAPFQTVFVENGKEQSGGKEDLEYSYSLESFVQSHGAIVIERSDTETAVLRAHEAIAKKTWET